jgi:hypothetical protein
MAIPTAYLFYILECSRKTRDEKDKISRKDKKADFLQSINPGL